MKRLKNTKIIALVLFALPLSTTTFAAGNPFDKEPTEEMLQKNEKQNTTGGIPRMRDVPNPSAEEQIEMSSGFRREMRDNAANIPTRFNPSSSSTLGGMAGEEDVREVKVIINGKALEYNNGTKAYTLMEIQK